MVVSAFVNPRVSGPVVTFGTVLSGPGEKGVVWRNGGYVRVYRGNGDKSTDTGMLMGDKVCEGVHWREGLCRWGEIPRKEGRTKYNPHPPPYGGTRNSPVGYMAWWVDTVVPVHAGGKWMLGPLLWEFVSLQLAHIG